MDIKTAKKVASLARLRLKDEEEAETRAKEMSGILAFVEQLSEVNTDGVAPLANTNDETKEIQKYQTND